MRLATNRGLAAGGRRNGQAALEYMVVAAMLIGAVAIMAVVLYTLRENGGRALELVGADCP